MPVTSVPTSWATVAIDTFITDVSSVMRNCPAARVSRMVPPAAPARPPACPGAAMSARMYGRLRVPPGRGPARARGDGAVGGRAGTVTRTQLGGDDHGEMAELVVCGAGAGVGDRLGGVLAGRRPGPRPGGVQRGGGWHHAGYRRPAGGGLDRELRPRRRPRPGPRSGRPDHGRHRLARPRTGHPRRPAD